MNEKLDKVRKSPIGHQSLEVFIQNLQLIPLYYHIIII